jgi:hypothetical protein
LTTKSNRDWPLGFKGVVGIAACAIGLAVIYFGYGIGTESPKKDAAAEARSAAPQTSKKPLRSMNVALGNMVFFAQDLGFAVKPAKDGFVDSSKVAARIESQLNGIRQLYRQEVTKTPGLAGAVMLQFDIAPSGEVSHVREIAPRLGDSDFRKAVAAEASSWSFTEIVTENLEVTCTLLFVHEGMDITTIVQWEKAVAQSSEQPNLVSSQPLKTGHGAAATTTAAKTDAKEFQIKYATSLRKDPNFSSISLTTLTIGTKITVLSRQGDWLQVRSTSNGPTGFIRKEFIASLDVARN